MIDSVVYREAPIKLQLLAAHRAMICEDRTAALQATRAFRHSPTVYFPMCMQAPHTHSVNNSQILSNKRADACFSGNRDLCGNHIKVRPVGLIGYLELQL